MAISQKITDLVELPVGADDDVLVIVDDPAGGAATKKITVANLFTAVLALAAKLADSNTFTDDNAIILPQVNDALTPTLAFGDGDTGLYEAADDGLIVSLAGVARWSWSGDTFGGFISDSGRLLNEAATATNPVLTIQGDLDTGIGRSAADQLSLIAGAVEGQRISEANGELLHTFSGTEVENISDASTTAAAATLTKVGEDFDVTCSVGDIVFVNGGTDAADYGTYIITAVTSATVLTVDRNFANTNTDVDFVVISKAIAIENSRDATAKLVLPIDDDAAAPTLSFGGDTGFYEKAANSIGVAIAGVLKFVYTSAEFGGNATDSARMLNEAASATNPVFAIRNDLDTGIGRHSADNLSIVTGGLEAIRAEDPADLQATETSLWLYDDDNGTIEQVTVGAADSGGTNFKLLRIPN